MFKMKKIITFTSEWNSIGKKIVEFLSEQSKTQTFTWENYEFSDFRPFAKQYGVETPQTCLLIDNNVVLEKTNNTCDEKIFSYWISLFAAPIDEVIIEDVVASEDDEAFVFSEEDAKALPDADEANESHPELDGAANGFVDVVLEAEDIVEAVPEAEDGVGVVLEADDVVGAILEADQTTLKPKAVTDADNLILSFDFEEEPVLFDDEFSSEDLGNDTPDDILDPEDLF